MHISLQEEKELFRTKQKAYFHAITDHIDLLWTALMCMFKPPHP